MQDLSVLSNDEIFKLLKSSGINAGPITASTRSVYEKKLTKVLTGMDSTIPAAPEHISPVKPKESLISKSVVSEPVVSLKASEAETVFVKPSTPKPRKEPEPEPEIIQVVEKPRKSILRKSTEETHFDNNDTEPVYYRKEETTTFNAASTIQPKIRSEFTRTTNSPMRQSTTTAYRKEPSPVRKEVPMPEFKLLKPSQPTTITQTATSYREPNIRKRTTTIEKPIPVSEARTSTSTSVKPKENGGSSIKYMIMVIIVTVIVFFVMTQLQSNPENPVE